MVSRFLWLAKELVFRIPDVIASYRYDVVILQRELILYKRSYPNFVGLLLLISYLSYLNISRFTWLAIIDPNFG